jgi:hypothetical protein
MRYRQAAAIFFCAASGLVGAAAAAPCDIVSLRQIACGFDRGDVSGAQVTLAAQYMYGVCVPADFQVASRWIRYAQANGHPDAHRLSAIWHRLWTLPSPGNAKTVKVAAKPAAPSSVTTSLSTTLPSPPANAEGSADAVATDDGAVVPARDDPLCTVAAPVPVQHVRATAFSAPASYRIDVGERCSADAIDAFVTSLHDAGVQVTRQNSELILQTGPASAVGRHALVCATYDVADVDVTCPPFPAREVERLVPSDATARFPGAIAVWKVAAPTTRMAVDLVGIPGGVDPAQFVVAWWPPYAVLRRQKGDAIGTIGVSIWAEPTAPSDGTQRCKMVGMQADVPRRRSAAPVPAPVACERTTVQCASCGTAAEPASFTQGTITCR